MEKIDNKRVYKNYYLNEWDGDTFNKYGKHPCQLCELADQCDSIADTLNKIEFFLCHSVNKKYKEEHPFAFFKLIM